jgi:ketosteroid isomerase-like protein
MMLLNDEKEIIALMGLIQQALDSKNLSALLEFYHPEITYIGPAFPQPIRGLAELKAAFESHFQTPQRTASEARQVSITRLGESALAVTALIDGRQIIYYSEQRFKGWLSRVFVEHEGGPLIILEHFTLAK